MSRNKQDFAKEVAGNKENANICKIDLPVLS